MNRMPFPLVAAAVLSCVAAVTPAVGETKPSAPLPAPRVSATVPVSTLGTWNPPACTGLFTDVPCASQFAAWVEQFSRDGITSGCATGLYCPDTAVTRRQMAVFVERAMHGTAKWPPFVVTVNAVLATDGSCDQAASGLALLAGIASIPTTGAGVPADGQHWLVKVGPGTYDLANSTATLPDYTDLEGGGRETTVITSGSVTINTGLRSALRHLTVNGRSPGGIIGLAVENDGGLAFLQDVVVDARGATSSNYAVSNTNSSLEVRDSTLLAVGGSADAGIYNSGTQYHSVLVANSVVNGHYDVQNSAGYAVQLVMTQSPGTLLNTAPGTYTCFNVYNASLAAKACP